MNIIGLTVHDPTLEGILEPPHLKLQVDSEPELTRGPDYFPGGWSITKYGGLYSYAKEGATVWAADFNSRFDDMPPLVDVEVWFEVRKAGSYDRTTYGLGTFAIQLQRGRQLLRRHANNWRLMASDYDVQARLLRWTPVQANAACRKWITATHPAGGICGRPDAVRVRIGEVDMPLCNEHKAEYMREQAEFQAAFKG